MTNFERFKKKTHLLSLVVHRVPLHRECVGQLCHLFSRGCLSFCGLLVVDDSHSDPMLCTFWWGNTKLKAVKLCTLGWKILECKTWFRSAHSERSHWSCDVLATQDALKLSALFTDLSPGSLTYNTWLVFRFREGSVPWMRRMAANDVTENKTSKH